MTQQDPRIAQRYAAHPSVWPKVFIVICLAIVLALTAWLAWAVWVHSTPKVTSSLSSWTIVGEHEAKADVVVSLKSGAQDPSCLLRAYAEDHTTVGDAPFKPVDGKQTVSVRTERKATSVELIGCTAKGQNDAR